MVPLAVSAALHPHLDRLNPEQRAAVLHATAGSPDRC